MFQSFRTFVVIANKKVFLAKKIVRVISSEHIDVQKKHLARKPRTRSCFGSLSGVFWSFFLPVDTEHL